MEPTGACMGPTEAHSARASGARLSRLGRASCGNGPASDRSAIMGRAPGRGGVGGAENRGTCSSGRAVLVGACCARRGAGRRSAALECACPDSGLVSALSGSG